MGAAGTGRLTAVGYEGVGSPYIGSVEGFRRRRGQFLAPRLLVAVAVAMLVFAVGGGPSCAWCCPPRTSGSENVPVRFDFGLVRFGSV